MQKRQWDRLMIVNQVLELFSRPGKPLQLKEIDKALGLTDGQASKHMKRARELGLVTFRDTLPMPRDKELGRLLARKYAPCEFLVVETDSTVVKPKARRAGLSGQDDTLHEQLGMAAAMELSRKLAKLKRLGVGAGRALFHAGRELIHYPQAREHGRHIAVIGLHGHVDRRIWRDSTLYPRQATDAIQVVDAFSASLRDSTPSRIHEALIQPSLEVARSKLVEHARFIEEGEWAEEPPEIALVGMGVMGGLPAMNRERPTQRRMQARRWEMMLPVRKAWSEIREICSAFFKEKGYIPVSDVCDRLFWVPEVSETGQVPYIRARRLIKEINTHILGVHTGLDSEPRGPRASRSLPRFASLDRAGKVVVVAGGSLKMRGLAKLLESRRDKASGRRFIDLLIIDQETARTLLEFRKPV